MSKKDNKIGYTIDSALNTLIKVIVAGAVIGGTYGASSFQDGVLTMENSRVKIEITFKD